MNNLFVWILLCYGASNIVVYGKIFSGVRNLELLQHTKFGFFIYEMITCMMCFSTWFGFFLGIFIFSPTNVYLYIPEYYSWFFDGLFSSGCVWVINSIIEYFEENVPNDK